MCYIQDTTFVTLKVLFKRYLVSQLIKKMTAFTLSDIVNYYNHYIFLILSYIICLPTILFGSYHMRRFITCNHTQ